MPPLKDRRSSIRRALLWSQLAAGGLLGLFGVMALIMIPMSTMAPLPPKEVLERIEGTIETVRGATQNSKPGLDGLSLIDGTLVVKLADKRLREVPLSSGFFLARDLDRRCGLNARNLASTAGQPVSLRLDPNGRIVDLRIGRILCVSYDSAEREGTIGGFLRARTFTYGPLLALSGLLLVGSASFGLGLWPWRGKA